jgi:hypothetical protein
MLGRIVCLGHGQPRGPPRKDHSVGGSRAQGDDMRSCPFRRIALKPGGSALAQGLAASVSRLRPTLRRCALAALVAVGAASGLAPGQAFARADRPTARTARSGIGSDGHRARAVGHTTNRSGVPGVAPFTLSCPSVSLCVATDSSGHVITSTDPLGGSGTWSSTQIDAANSIDGLSCPSITMCAGVDSAGNILTSRTPGGRVRGMAGQRGRERPRRVVPNPILLRGGGG